MAVIAQAALGAVLLFTDPSPAGADRYEIELYDPCTVGWYPYSTSTAAFCPRTKRLGWANCAVQIDQDHFFRVRRCPVGQPCESPAYPDDGSRVYCLSGPCREHSPFFVEPE